MSAKQMNVRGTEIEVWLMQTEKGGSVEVFACRVGTDRRQAMFVLSLHPDGRIYRPRHEGEAALPFQFDGQGRVALWGDRSSQVTKTPEAIEGAPAEKEDR